MRKLSAELRPEIVVIAALSIAWRPKRGRATALERPTPAGQGFLGASPPSWSLCKWAFVCPNNVLALRYDDAKGVLCAGPRLELASDQMVQVLVRGIGVITGRPSNLHEPLLPVSPTGPECKH